MTPPRYVGHMQRSESSPLSGRARPPEFSAGDRLRIMSEVSDCELPTRESLLGDHVDAVLEQARRICRLEAGWNGAGAHRVVPAAAANAVRLAAKVTCPECLAPQLSPTVDGNVLVDWTWAADHVEIEISGDGTFEAHIRADGAERTISSSLDDDGMLRWLAWQVTGVGASRFTPPN